MLARCCFSGCASATSVRDPPLAAGSGAAVAADGGLETDRTSCYVGERISCIYKEQFFFSCVQLFIVSGCILELFEKWHRDLCARNVEI